MGKGMGFFEYLGMGMGRGVAAVKFLEGQTKKIAKKGSIFFITLLITLLIFITLSMNVYAKNII